MDRWVGRRPVVVGVDGSEYALRALRWGIGEAVRRHTPLRLVSAFDWSTPLEGGHPDLRDRYRELLLERTEISLGAAARLAESGLAEWDEPDTSVDHELLVGAPCAVLGSESRSADLVVVGQRGETGLGDLLTGSTATELAVRAACTVVVVRGPERDPAEAVRLPVLVGVDEAVNDGAIAYAFEAAASRQVPLLLAHRRRTPRIDSDAVGSLERIDIDIDAREALDAELAVWSDKHPEVPVVRVGVRWTSAAELTARSADAQLVVVGTSLDALAGPHLGSLAHTLVHRAECPVAVVPPTEAGGDDAR